MTERIESKLAVLREAALDDESFERVLGRLIDATLSMHQGRLRRFEQDLHEFEARYGMESQQFYDRFAAGELGDAMDFFEWAGLFELCRDLRARVRRLEQVA